MKDDLCPICCRDVETIQNVLWSCPFASNVWAEIQSLVHKWSCIDEEFSQLWEMM